MKNDNIYAVFGLGMFGMEICRQLSEKGAKVIAVDKDHRTVEKVKDMVTQAVLFDSTDEEALKNVGIQDVDMAIVAIGDSISGNILTTVLLKNLGVPYVMARAMSDVHAQVLRQIGANEIINIAVDQGKRIAERILAPNAMDRIPLPGDQSLSELRLPEAFAGKTLNEIGLRKKYHVTLVAVKRMITEIDEVGNPRQGEHFFSPGADDKLELNDSILLLGKHDDIEKIKEI